MLKVGLQNCEFWPLGAPALEIEFCSPHCSSGSPTGPPNDEQDEAADDDARVDVEELVAVLVRRRIVKVGRIRKRYEEEVDGECGAPGERESSASCQEIFCGDNPFGL